MKALKANWLSVDVIGVTQSAVTGGETEDVCVCLCGVFSYVFVMGDFNFRTDDLSASDVKNSIAAGDLRSLWAYDQV